MMAYYDRNVVITHSQNGIIKGICGLVILLNKKGCILLYFRVMRNRNHVL